METAKRVQHNGTANPEVSKRELENRAIAREAAAGGMVLLKNDGLLPLMRETKIALLGGGAWHMLKGGTGSGDVNERHTVQIVDALAEAGFQLTSGEWLTDFGMRYRKAREDWKNEILGTQGDKQGTEIFENYARNTFLMPDGRKISDCDTQGADTAVFVISRVAGEAADRRPAKGDYYLTDFEVESLRWLNENQIPTVLLINAGSVVDLTDVKDLPMVKAILLISQPGQEGGAAVADILAGDVTPSGKLTDTWACEYRDYPNADSFGVLSGHPLKEYYKEGIYVGYRYFDAFDMKPLYPFGYGLSYTDFAIACTGIRVSEGRVIADVTVTNTGDIYSGREVVQVYAACPRGRLVKEFRRLVGFLKTPVLAPGESFSDRIFSDYKCFASFDEEAGAWILEKGKYGIWVGNSSANPCLSGVFEITEEIVLEETGHICPIQEKLEEILPSEEMHAALEAEWIREAEEKKVPVITIKDISFRKIESNPEDLKADAIRKQAEEIVSRIPLDELVPLFYGELNMDGGALGASGYKVPGSAAETSYAFADKYGIPVAVLADGPAGLRLINQYDVDLASDQPINDGFFASVEGGFFLDRKPRENVETWYQYCTAFPVGTLLAQTWDEELVEKVGRAAAREMQEFGVSWWLAPGMNIHRNPLCGRNFEYYSEDPLVSGKIAAAMVRGVQSRPGCGATIKHLACNNQEDYRMDSDSILNERTLREIYLRGFEIAVKEAQPRCIMTSYNMINGIYASNCEDICTQAARKEWGFKGLIMTDWTTTFPNEGSESWKCIDAGNDLIMPGHPIDDESIRQALADGQLSEKKARECAVRIVAGILAG